ncbi:3-deoxy-D-manno-octulosonate 8-phosphate phosphatase [Haemophilus influenzae]|uniref:3-deoxy-D-manno-octulosonate 8-phosphate phosphatase n=1 Tax=Haemophilus influenzae TaxID=727 RepID=A0A2X1Q291_HAEIF|nr:3-deoxy-D-manno-octulosonate 8-phosphate phosphatase [Haemophilus influenzae]
MADAPIYVKNTVDHVLSTNGGKGAFREMSDMILQAQGKSSVFDSAQGFPKISEKYGAVITHSSNVIA